MKDITYDEFLQACKVLKQYRLELKWRLEQVDAELKKIPTNCEITKDTLLSEVRTSVRLYNVLTKNQTRLKVAINKNTKLEDLGNISASHFSRSQSVGEGTLKELKSLCLSAGIKLKP